MAEDPEERKRKQRSRQASRREVDWAYVQKVLSQQHCAHCGNHDTRVLHWHHDPDRAEMHGPKRHSISYMVNRGMPIPAIRAELRKCVVLCANCHSILHYEERKGERDKRQGR